MQAAINANRISKNFPCWIRYVLQVSKIILATSSMFLCAPSLFTRINWYKPKSNPRIQIKNPNSNILYCPGSRAGILRSASLPKTNAGNAKIIKKENNRFIRLKLENKAVLRSINIKDEISITNCSYTGKKSALRFKLVHKLSLLI